LAPLMAARLFAHCALMTAFKEFAPSSRILLNLAGVSISQGMLSGFFYYLWGISDKSA